MFSQQVLISFIFFSVHDSVLFPFNKRFISLYLKAYLLSSTIYTVYIPAACYSESIKTVLYYVRLCIEVFEIIQHLTAVYKMQAGSTDKNHRRI